MLDDRLPLPPQGWQWRIDDVVLQQVPLTGAGVKRVGDLDRRTVFLLVAQSAPPQRLWLRVTTPTVPVLAPETAPHA